MTGLRKYLERDHFLFGLMWGIVSPAFVFALMVVISDTIGKWSGHTADLAGVKIRTLFLVAVCSNLFWIRYYNRSFHSHTLKGVVTSTMILSLLWFWKYYAELHTG